MSTREQDIGWFAGFYEGKGYIYAHTTKYISKNTGEARIAYTLRVCLTQNDIEPLEKCADIFPSMALRGPYKNKTSKNPHYQCYASNDNAELIINTVFSMLSHRRQQQALRELSKYRLGREEMQRTKLKSGPIKGKKHAA